MGEALQGGCSDCGCAYEISSDLLNRFRGFCGSNPCILEACCLLAGWLAGWLARCLLAACLLLACFLPAACCCLLLVAAGCCCCCCLLAWVDRTTNFLRAAHDLDAHRASHRFGCGKQGASISLYHARLLDHSPANSLHGGNVPLVIPLAYLFWMGGTFVFFI